MKPSRAIILIFSIILSFNLVVTAETYYYKRVKIVSQNGKIRNVNDDSHYMTFTPTVCYDSDAHGNGTANYSMSYIKTENNIILYHGASFYGADTYCYVSSDKNRINLKHDGITYVYAKTTETGNIATKRESRSSYSPGTPIIQGNDGTSSSQIPEQTTRRKAKRKCPGCNGEGYLPEVIEYTATYTVENEWCSKCGKYMLPHVHKRPLCRVCFGKKMIE
ncbi:MAG: hypothetical protein NC248_06070 [Bacteroides sp.]|nr:hypothetical protein [Bacteroides sp.]MCM1390779.1 hypothetical protein [Bacteroides sp.]